MFLIVGLGNPGKKYEKTRHNIGARVIDQLKVLNLKGVVLAKPKTFMNISGKAVKTLLQDYKEKPENLIIIHDDIDLPLGKIRIVKNRGAAGHKGVASIIEALKTKDFTRIRIGIQPKKGKPRETEAFVLQKFTKEEKKGLKEVIEKACQAVQTILEKGPEKTMTQYNK